MKKTVDLSKFTGKQKSQEEIRELLGIRNNKCLVYYSFIK